MLLPVDDLGMLATKMIGLTRQFGDPLEGQVIKRCSFSLGLKRARRDRQDARSTSVAEGGNMELMVGRLASPEPAVALYLHSAVRNYNR